MLEGSQRRLAAILAADVAGYSRLMGADEAAALAALRELRGALFEPIVASHRGNVMKRMGDGWLVEFAAVVDAVRCAIAVQRGLADHPLIKLRIGVHIGDIVHQDEDIYGDGINVAARLQEIAAPGSVVISDLAERSIDDKLAAEFTNLGAQALKNISTPVTAFAWGDMRASSQTVASEPAPRDKPSIAVLPFDNLSNDPDQEYFADGISEDIITELSRFHWFFVIARNSSFSYKGISSDVRQVARDLGVHYLLEGSVRKLGNRVRVTAQLIDGGTGRHVWADRFDRELDDIFAVQDEITAAITSTVAPSLLEAETNRAKRKAPENLDSWDLVLRGNWHYGRFSADGFTEARRFYREALALDPDNSIALAGLAHALLLEVGAVLAGDPMASRREAIRLAHQALEIDRDNAWAHLAMARAHHVARENDKAVVKCETALGLNPNLAAAEGFLGLVLAHMADYERSRQHIDRAFRLSPRDPEMTFWRLARAVAALVAGHYREYLDEAVRLVEVAGDFLPGMRHYVAAHAHFDRMDKAHAMVHRIIEAAPNDTISRIRQSMPLVDPAARELFFGGLAKAGLPE